MEYGSCCYRFHRHAQGVRLDFLYLGQSLLLKPLSLSMLVLYLLSPAARSLLHLRIDRGFNVPYSTAR
jgi:hypothetical protein